LVSKEQRFGILRTHAYQTKPGLLNCQVLIHSILPEFAKSRYFQQEMLTTIRNALLKSKGLDSIAIPVLLNENYDRENLQQFCSIFLEVI
jgi:hypothetical protein